MDISNLSDLFEESIIEDLNLLKTNFKNNIPPCEPLYQEDLDERITAMKSITNEFIPNLAEQELQEFFKHLLPCANSVVNLIFEKIMETVSLKEMERNFGILENTKKHLQMLIDVIQVLDTILDCVVLRELHNFEILRHLLVNLLEILFKIFNICKKSKTTYKDYFDSLGEVVLLFKKCQEVSSKFFKVIESLSYDNLNNESAVLVEKALVILGQIGEVLAGMNAKAMVESWKSYLNLLQKHSENVDNLQISVIQPLTFFSNEIQQNLHILADSETDDKTMQKTLKMTDFFVRIASHICLLLETEEARKEAVVFLIKMFSFDTALLKHSGYSDTISSRIQTCVIEQCEQLCRKLIEDKKVFKAVCDIPDIIIEENLQGTLLLLLQIIRCFKEFSKNVKDFSAFNLHKYVQAIFVIVEKSYAEFFWHLPLFSTYENLFDAILVNCIILLNLMDRNQLLEVEVILLKSILSKNIWCSLLASEVWTFFAYIQPPEYGYALLCNLLERNKDVLNATFSQRPEFVLFGHLISKLFQGLTNEYKFKFAEKFPLCDNLHLWNNIGVKNLPRLPCNITEELVANFIKKSDLFLDGKLSAGNFLYLCNTCEVLSEVLPEKKDNNLTLLKNYLIKLWNIDTEDEDLLTFPNFQVFIDKLCIITGKFASTLTSKEALMVLHQLKTLSETGFTSTLYASNIIDSFSTKQFQGTLGNDALVLLIDLFVIGMSDKNALIQQENLERFVAFFRNTSHKEFIYECLKRHGNLLQVIKDFVRCHIQIQDSKTEEYFENQKQYSFIHNCIVWPQAISHQSKKLKEDDEQAVVLVKRIKDDITSLRKYHQESKLSEEVVADLMDISHQLTDLIS